MKKILLLLFTAVFTIMTAGCEEETTTDISGITPPAPEYKEHLTVNGIKDMYIIPIADTGSEPRKFHIQFFLRNDTANDYYNIKIIPEIKVNDKILTKDDGLTFEVNTNGITNLTKQSLVTIDMYIIYTGKQIPFFKFDVKITSDNMDTEYFDFNSGSFYTYLQAVAYKKGGTKDTFTTITADTEISTAANEPVKIIFINLFTTNFPRVLLESESNSNIILLENSFTSSSGVEYKPCSKAYDDKGNGTFSIGKDGICYLEISAAASDILSYNPLTHQNDEYIPATPHGYKPTDKIKITIK